MTNDREVELLREVLRAAIAVAESTIGLEGEPSWHTGPAEQRALRELLVRYHDEFCPECPAPETEDE